MVWGVEVSWKSLHFDVPDVLGVQVVDLLGVVELHQEVEEIVVAGVLGLVELVEARVLVLVLGARSGLLEVGDALLSVLQIASVPLLKSHGATWGKRFGTTRELTVRRSPGARSGSGQRS